MFIEPMIEKAPSSVGAACRSVSISVSAMPLLRSLDFPTAGCFYKHAAPNGAITPAISEVGRAARAVFPRRQILPRLRRAEDCAPYLGFLSPRRGEGQ